MPSPSALTDSLQNSVSAVTGRNAPKTGEYYDQIYSGIDSSTGVPVVGVNLHTTRDSGPTPLDGLSDAQTLDIVLRKDPPIQTPATTTSSQETPSRSVAPVINDTTGGGGLPLAGFIIFILLSGLMWLVYTIIRIWQNTQSQKAIMRATATGKVPLVETPTSPPHVPMPKEGGVISGNTFDMQAIETSLQNNSTEDWRHALENLDKELNNLLTRKGIQGESLSDKLKVVSAGDFSSIDIAWEAHQTAKDLLSMHDDKLKTQDLSRVLKLFKQVFAEHHVI